MYPAWEQILVGFQLSLRPPGGDGIARLLGNFKLNRALGLLLHGHGA